MGSPVLVRIDNGEGESMSPRRETDAYPASAMSSQSVASEKSTASLHLTRSGSGLKTPRRKPKKSVQFKRNNLQEVFVYEVDNSLFIDIQYQRNRVGWLLIILALMFDLCTTVLVVYCVSAQGPWNFQARPPAPKLSYYSVLFWASVWKVPLFILLLAAMLISDTVRLSAFKKLFSADGPMICLWGITLGGTVVGQMVAANEEQKNGLIPQYLPIVNLFLVWVLIWRKATRNSVFIQEIALTVLIVAGYVIAAWKSFNEKTWSTDFGVPLNLWLTALSLIYTAWCILTERMATKSPSVIVTLAPAIITDILMFLISGLIFLKGDKQKLEDAEFWSIFDPQWSIWGIGAGCSFFVSQCLYLSAARYLDVISIAAATGMKTVLLTYLVHYIVSPDLPPLIRAFINESTIWNTYLWIGTPFVLLGGLGLVIFSSVKRQFVARRVAAIEGRRKPRDPYKPKQEAPASPTAGGVVGDAVRGSPTKLPKEEQRPPPTSPSKRAVLKPQKMTREEAQARQLKMAASF